MKKIILSILTSLLFISSECIAMTFSQPVKIGSIFVTPSSGIVFENTSYNNGTPTGKFMIRNKSLPAYKGNGMVRWGDEKTGIYMFYGKYPFSFGDKDKNFQLATGIDVSIKRIDNNGDIVMYLLENDGSDVRSKNYFLLGRRKDGVWVKYFNAYEHLKIYFGENRTVYLSSMYCQDDSIVVSVDEIKSGETIGEIRFNWDDVAQWFGVEKVVY